MSWYRTHGVTVVNQPDAAPMSFQDADGKPKGFVIDVWRKWSLVTGIPVHFAFASWSENIEKVASGKFDVHGGLIYSEECGKLLDFSAPYHTMRISLNVLGSYDADIPVIRKQYTIGMLDMGDKNRLHDEVPNASVVKFHTLKDVARALNHGKIRAAIGHHPTLAYEMKRLGATDTLILKKTLRVRAFQAAVAKDNRVLLDLVNKGFQDIDPKALDTIHQRWFVPSPTNYRWLRDVTLVILSMVVVLLGYVYYRRRQRG